MYENHIAMFGIVNNDTKENISIEKIITGEMNKNSNN